MDNHFGNKANYLHSLKKSGFNIPSFISVNKNEIFKVVLKKIEKELNPKAFFAVRSSSGLEDGVKKSYAGHFRTELGIRYDQLEEAWIKVKDALPNDDQSGIIIQEFIPGDYSGVIFIDLELKKASINALDGICKSVVEGWDCEQYNFSDWKLENKYIKNSYDCLSFVKNEIIKKRVKSSLRKEYLKCVVEESIKIAKHFKAPQDIEWTFKDNKLFILQSRPISRSIWTHSNDNMLFDSANIGESYSGIVLPLTSSFAKKLYKDVYINSLLKSGVEEKKIITNSKIFDELIDAVYGRMYYRMDNWYRMMAMIPGFDRNNKNLKNMLSLNFDEKLDISIYKPSTFLKLTYYPRILFKFIFFDKIMKRFHKEVELTIADAAHWNYKELSIVKAQYYINFLLNGVIKKWYLTIENDTMMMTLYGKLSKGINKKSHQKLLDFKSVSTKQVNQLSLLSKELCKDIQIKKSLVEKNSNSFRKYMRQNIEAKKLFDSYINKFGGRFANESKLETSDINEDFVSLSNLLLTYSTMNTHLKESENKSENYFESMFKKFASRREDFRLLRANMFGVFRRLSISIGNEYVRRGLIKNRDDIFYLDFEDIDGTRKMDDIDFSKINTRKKEYKFFKTFQPPSHFKVVNGIWPSFLDSNADHTNSGIGASKGKITGKAVVLEEFSIPEKDSFDILITRRTDPGWTSLMALSKGIVVEHGGILSHASIVARELGIPAVIGIKNACKKFKTGDTIFVDGDKGIVEAVSK